MKSTLKCFNKSTGLGAGKDATGKIYEWDSQHGTVEVYDRSGRNHLGEFNHITDEQMKPADPSRKVEK